MSETPEPPYESAAASQQSTSLQPSQPIIAPTRDGASRLFASPGFKFIVIGVLSLVLMIPAIMIWGLTEERADRARDVSHRIIQGWGSDQVFNGPYISIPAPRSQLRSDGSATLTEVVPNWILLMPKNLDIQAKLAVERRVISIYSVPVYQTKLTIKGHFDPVDLQQYQGEGIKIDEIALLASLSDISGIRSDATLSIDNGPPLPFSPGTGGPSSIVNENGYYPDMNSANLTSGIHRTIDADTLKRGFDFNMELVLNGSNSLALAPAGQTSTFEMSGNWQSPNFEGVFLPDTKTQNAEGFTAKWSIPYLARGIESVVRGNTLPLGSTAVSVQLVEPVLFYQLVTRTLKYAIGIISLVFLALFVMELRTRRPVHWIQYVLTGLAMIIFYVLLLALAEHVGFGLAYLVAASAVTAQISLYMGAVTKSRRTAAALALVMGIIYTILYLVLREEEYALLAGSIVAFIAIGLTMALTLNSDLSGQARTPISR